MLFPSAIFAFLFLPVTFAGFFLLARRSHSWAAFSLFTASLVFYGYWMPAFTTLLLASITFNFYIGGRIARALPEDAVTSNKSKARRWLIAGVLVNLALLGYFKYANFFIDSVNTAFALNWNIGRTILPIGISFFTFTQIAFLADAYLKGVKEYQFIHYGLFVTYFPHLVAGPVLHHAQMMPQFGQAGTYRLNAPNIATGMTLFVLGLIKKVVLADGISPYADTVFDAADKGTSPTQVEGWLGAVAYTFQLYFDFSGYSDMAIGLSLLFNIRLPYNFASPYKALNISDFWRRWHMSLSAFLRDYLYIPLGGNQFGRLRRYLNLMITMVLGGLWHGASWTFIFWGMLHGIYLVINHGFRGLVARYCPPLSKSKSARLLFWALTMLSVIVAWVFFRAQTFSGAALVLQAMAGATPASAYPGIEPLLWNAGLSVAYGTWWCIALALIAFVAPNTNRIGEAILVLSNKHERLCFVLLGASLSAAVFIVIVNLTRKAVSPFIYFNF